MNYDFKMVHKRFNTGSKKWDELTKYGVKPTEDIIPFSVADMEFVTAPEIVTALKKELDTSIMGYANPTKEYLAAVCSWMKRRFNWTVQPEWILSSHGIVDAFHDAVRIYTKENEGILLLTPVYYPMYHAIKANKRVLVDCPLQIHGDRYEIDFADFEKKAADPNTKLFILCSPGNPVGRVWTKEELTKLGDICLKHNVLVLSDEIHADLVMPGYKHIAYASLSEKFADNCIVCTAPSKTFNLAGLQTSNIIIKNPAIRDKFFQFSSLTNPNPKCNILGYRACEAAYNNCEAWLEDAIKIIDTNRQKVTDFMAKEFPQVKVFRLEATYLLWMDWNGLGLNYKELERINHEEARLFFDEGYVFGAQGEGFERWNLACPTKYIEDALARMKAAYSKHIKK